MNLRIIWYKILWTVNFMVKLHQTINLMLLYRDQWIVSLKHFSNLFLEVIGLKMMYLHAGGPLPPVNCVTFIRWEVASLQWKLRLPGLSCQDIVLILSPARSLHYSRTRCMYILHLVPPKFLLKLSINSHRWCSTSRIL